VNGSLGTLSTNAEGTTRIDTTAVTAVMLDFNDAIVISKDTVLTAGDSINFASTVDTDGTPQNVQFVATHDVTLHQRLGQSGQEFGNVMVETTGGNIQLADVTSNVITLRAGGSISGLRTLTAPQLDLMANSGIFGSTSTVPLLTNATLIAANNT